MRKSIVFAILALCAAAAQSADIYVSAATGKNKNDGSREAPLRNLWKALENAADGDVIHVAEGLYPGKMKCNWFKIDKAVSIIGGYAEGFASRDPVAHRTLFQAQNENNDKKGTGLGVFTIEFDHSKPEPQDVKMVFDGLVFDDGFAQSYHPVKGKPEGVETGMWLEPPAKGDTPFASAKRYLVYSAAANRATGEIAFRNCAFVNSGNYAVNINWHKGKVTIENCVFCNNLMMGAVVACSNRDPAVEWEFARNTVLFTWSRTSELSDMGFGVRTTAGVTADIHDNVIGLNVLTGFDNTMGNPKAKKTSIDGNIFFLNRESDIQMAISPSIAKVRVEDFEDLEGTDGIESIEDNENLDDPGAFAGRINAAYLNAFLSMKYSEKTKLDEGRCNALRSVLGLPLQGTITTKVDMFANRYPLDDAMKLFGAIDGKGASATWE